MKLLSQARLHRLYESIGKEAGLRRMLREFYRRMSEDILIGFFFTDKDLDAIAEMQLQFLSRAFGATPSYRGKAPAQAHTELPPILAGHFDRRLRILEGVLRDAGLAPEEIETWVAFEGSFRPAIQGTEGGR